MNIAIIPARGGSKRLPGKNIKLLAGKPLIAWTIEAAIQSNMFDHVFVSTDCKEIARISKQFGAEIPFMRPTKLASDTATTNDVITHLVDWFDKNHSQQVSNIAILQPTSPLRNARHIEESMDLMHERSAKAVISVCELEHPIQFCNTLGINGSMDGFIEHKDNKRTQELGAFYRLNGAIYLFNREYVNRLNEIYSEGTYSYIMSTWLSVDIDTENDFKLAEYYIRTVSS